MGGIANKGMGLDGVCVFDGGKRTKEKKGKSKEKNTRMITREGRATDMMQDVQVGCCVFTELPV